MDGIISNKAKGKLLFVLLLIVAFPMLQHAFSFFESGKLHGAVSGIADPQFSWGKWMDGSYQVQKNAYLNDSTGCRPDLVRLNNQLDFWLFKKLHAHSVVIGKDGCLFEHEYADEYYGLDHVNDDSMAMAVWKLRKVQDTLERLGKTFVFLYAPSKAYYFSDKLPARPWGCKPDAPTNYYTFKRLATAAGIKQIDYNAWFLSMKDKSDNLLFSRLGIHWTEYGSLIGADSFIKFVEHARHIQMPELRIGEIHKSDTPQRTDDDLAVGLNLIYPLKPEHFSYPEYHYDHEGNKTMPKTIYIGDSFLWVWLADDLMQQANGNFGMWYYCIQAWNQNTITGKEELKTVDEIDWHKEIMTSDCITILYVPSSFYCFVENRSPIKRLYDYFYPAKK